MTQGTGATPKRSRSSAGTGEPAADAIDLAVLGEWMDGQGLGSGPLTDVRRLAGGTQNIMLSFQRGGRGYVLRRPPPHPTADGSGTMRKDIRVLTSLAATDVPHPRLTSASPTYADTHLWA